MENCVIFVAKSPKTGIIQKSKQTQRNKQKTHENQQSKTKKTPQKNPQKIPVCLIP